MAKNRIFAAFLFVILSFVFVNKIHAQNPGNYYIEDPRTFYAGLLAGANLTQVDGDSYAGYHKVGLNLGGIVYMHHADNLATSLEILFSQKGSRGHRPQESGIVGERIIKYGINLNYAEIPLQINYFDRRRSHFGAGFSYSQLISSKETIVTNLRTVQTDTLKFRKADINFILGGNLHLIKGLFLNLRFQYSLIPIRTKENINSDFGRGEQYNNLWTIRLMYLF